MDLGTIFVSLGGALITAAASVVAVYYSGRSTTEALAKQLDSAREIKQKEIDAEREARQFEAAREKTRSLRELERNALLELVDEISAGGTLAEYEASQKVGPDRKLYALTVILTLRKKIGRVLVSLEEGELTRLLQQWQSALMDYHLKLSQGKAGSEVEEAMNKIAVGPLLLIPELRKALRT